MGREFWLEIFKRRYKLEDGMIILQEVLGRTNLSIFPIYVIYLKNLYLI
jgi:hypothetical protein